MISRFLLVLSVSRFASVLGQYGTDGPQEQMFDYHSMPTLSQIDDFQSCMSKPEAVYCVIDLELLEDPGPLYQFIKNFSSMSYKTYQHTKLLRGVCCSHHCGLNISRADPGESTAEILKKIMNTTLHEKYGLQVDTVTVQYCLTQNDNTSVDVLDVVVAALVIMVLLINLGCSLFYAYFSKLNGKDNKFLLAFCVQKNWKALMDRGRAGGDQIKCFQALRFYSMVAIISLHVGLGVACGISENSEFIEQFYDDFYKSVFFNIRLVVQIFFVMGGFLMAHKMFVYAETRPFSLKTVFRIIISRWLRLMPIVLTVMGLAMTWVQRMGSGPLWNFAVKRERDLCRKNWWQLVILMPNLFFFDNLCLPQTWYLGADTQLFLITMLVLLVIWRWPRSVIPVLSSVWAASLLVPFLQTYFMNLLPVRASLSPELLRWNFGKSATFYYAYLSPQSNWGAYCLGVLTAYFYRRAQTKKLDLTNNFLMKTLFLISVPVALATVAMGWDLHHRKASALESAAFNVLNQNFFALNICIFIIGYFYRCNRIYVNAVEWGPLQPLGTLSYSAMLLHTAILRIYFGQTTRLLYASIYSIVIASASIAIITYLGALPIHLLVEAPAIQLQKLLLGTKRNSGDSKNSDKVK